MSNPTAYANYTSFQFLSVCHYINIIGNLLSNDDFLQPELKSNSVPVLNAFFEYLTKSKNQTKRKEKFLQKILRKTDLYGGRKNETLDEKYINQTYEYIINKALFSHYEGILGYLAGIISRSNNLTLSRLKESIHLHFSHNYIYEDRCSTINITSNLTSNSITKILEFYIWPIFPEPENDTDIMDINYMYAMAGMKIASALPTKLSNLSFDDYIQLSSSTEVLIVENSTLAWLLEAFSIPALFFQAHKLKDNFKERDIASQKFWDDAFKTLFSYFKNRKSNIIQKVVMHNLHSKLSNEISQILSRTQLAEKILREKCLNFDALPYHNFIISEYQSGSNLCVNYKLPKLEDEYKKQFNKVRETFHEIQKGLLQQTLADTDLEKRLNSPSIVKSAQMANHVVSPGSIFGALSIVPLWLFRGSIELSKDIYLLFAVEQNSREYFYALKQKEGALILIQRDGYESNFDREVGNSTDVEPETSYFKSTKFKDENENATVFIEKVAGYKADLFVKKLRENFWNMTSREKVNSFLLSLVPFYSCVKNIQEDHTRDAIFSCTMDIITLLPIVGQVAKYSTILSRCFVMEGGLAAISSMTTGAVTRAALKTGISEIVQAATRTVTQVLTKQMLKKLTIGSIRLLDPGVEFVYRVGGFGMQFYKRLFKHILSNGKRFGASRHFLGQLRSGVKSINRNRRMLSDLTGMVPRVVGRMRGFEVVRYTFPGGSNFFGPRCLRLGGNVIAELRTSSAGMNKIPVVPSRKVGDTMFYKRVHTKSGKLYPNEYKLETNDLLYFVSVDETGAK